MVARNRAEGLNRFSKYSGMDRILEFWWFSLRVPTMSINAARCICTLCQISPAKKATETLWITVILIFPLHIIVNIAGLMRTRRLNNIRKVRIFKLKTCSLESFRWTFHSHHLYHGLLLKQTS